MAAELPRHEDTRLAAMFGLLARPLQRKTPRRGRLRLSACICVARPVYARHARTRLCGRGCCSTCLGTPVRSTFPHGRLCLSTRFRAARRGHARRARASLWHLGCRLHRGGGALHSAAVRPAYLGERLQQDEQQARRRAVCVVCTQ